MSGQVVAFPQRGPQVVSKRQLCGILDRSPRWIEQQVGRGMPVLERTDRYGGRRYEVAAVQAWLAEGRPQRAGSEPQLRERVDTLERQMAELLARLP